MIGSAADGEGVNFTFTFSLYGNLTNISLEHALMSHVISLSVKASPRQGIPAQQCSSSRVQWTSSHSFQPRPCCAVPSLAACPDELPLALLWAEQAPL